MDQRINTSKSQYIRIKNEQGQFNKQKQAFNSHRQNKQQGGICWAKVDFFKTIRTQIRDTFLSLQNNEKNNQRLILTSKGIKQRLNTIQINLDNFPNGHTETVKNQKNRTFYSNQKINYNYLKSKQLKKKTELAFTKSNEKQNIINQYKNQKQIMQSKNSELLKKDSKNHLLFLFQTKVKNDLVLREKNIMKIRNLTLSKKKKLNTQI